MTIETFKDKIAQEHKVMEVHVSIDDRLVNQTSLPIEQGIQEGLIIRGYISGELMKLWIGSNKEESPRTANYQMILPK